MASAGRFSTTLLPGDGPLTGYQTEVMADSPVAYWRLDETGTGEFLADSSGNGRHMSLPVNGGSTPVAGLLPTESGRGGHDFEASSSQYWAGGVSTLLGDTFSIEAWVKPEGNTDRTIIAQDGGFQLKLDGGGYPVLLHQNVAELMTATGPLTNGTTYHLVATKSGSTRKMYVNGVDVTSLVGNVTVPNGGITRIGAQEFGEYMDGVSDEIAIYSTALSQSRVLAHYEEVFPPSSTPVNGDVLDLTWDTRATVNGDVMDMMWDLRGAVSGTVLDLNWDLRTTATGDALDLTWDTRAAMSGDILDLIWDTKAAVAGNPLDLIWDTRAAMSGDILDLLWDLRTTATGVPLDLIWDLRTTATGDVLDLLWDLRTTATGVPLDLLWDLKGAVSGDALDLLWDLKGAVSGTVLDLVWDLYQAAAAVNGAPLSLVWDVKGAVSGDALDLLWDLRAHTAGVPLDLIWDLRNPTNGDVLDLVWDLRTTANGDVLDLVWDLKGATAGVPLDLIWDLKGATAGVPLDLLWDLRTTANGDVLDLVWDLRTTATGVPLDLLWDLRTEANSVPLDLLWDLRAEAVATLTLIWDLLINFAPSPQNEGILDGVIRSFILVGGQPQHTETRRGEPIVPVRTGGEPGNLTGAVFHQTENTGEPTRTTTGGVINDG